MKEKFSFELPELSEFRSREQFSNREQRRMDNSGNRNTVKKEMFSSELSIFRSGIAKDNE